MKKAMFKLLLIVLLFVSLYFITSSAFQAISAYLLDRFDPKFGQTGSYMMGLYLTAAIFTPSALLLHLMTILFNLSRLRGITVKRLVIVEVYSAAFAAGIPGAISLLTADVTSLGGGILNAIYFLSLVGSPILSTYVIIVGAESDAGLRASDPELPSA